MPKRRKFQGFERACIGLYAGMRTWLYQGRPINFYIRLYILFITQLIGRLGGTLECAH